MTLTLPTYRNSFHLAWLLLFVPPVISILATWSNDNPPIFLSQGIRLILTAIAVLPLIGLRSAPAVGRAPRLLKELRTLMPGCLVAVLVPGFLVLNEGRESVEWSLWTYGLGCLWMGASAFGSEFEQRTITSLLGQALARWEVFLEKLCMLGLLLAFAAIELLLALGWDSGAGGEGAYALAILLIPMFVFCSGPLFSLLSRGTLAGLIFTLSVPFLLWGGALLVVLSGYRLLRPGEIPSDAWVGWLLGIGIPAYLLATQVLGWRVFRSLEIREGGAGGRSRAAWHPLSGPLDALFQQLFPVTSGTWQLVRKEILLHVIPWLVASLMVGLWVLWLALRLFTGDPEFRRVLNDVSGFAVLPGLLGAVIVVASGLASIAEERELGTLEWQLTQPVSVRRQWWVKMAVTVMLAATLGLLLPAGLLAIGIGPREFLRTFGDVSGLGVVAGVGGFVSILVISIYASSIARNTMMAAPAAIGIGAVLGGIVYLTGMWVVGIFDRMFIERIPVWEIADVMPAWAPSRSQLFGIGVGLIASTGILLVTALLGLSRRNFRRMAVPARVVSRQLIGVVLAWVIVASVLGGAFGVLMGSRLQADTVEAYRPRRARALGVVDTLVASGQLDPSIFREYRIATNAPAEVLLQAIIASEGPEAMDRMVWLLRPPHGLVGRGLDPALAQRYGLAVGSNSVNPGTNAPSARAFRLDPVLARRYGLLRVPTNAPAAGPQPAPPTQK